MVAQLIEFSVSAARTASLTVRTICDFLSKTINVLMFLTSMLSLLIETFDVQENAGIYRLYNIPIA